MLDRPIERRLIHLPEPIKEIGNSQITVRLFADITPTFKLVIQAEGGVSAAGGSTGTQEQPTAELEGEENSPTGENSEISA